MAESGKNVLLSVYQVPLKGIRTRKKTFLKSEIDVKNMVKMLFSQYIPSPSKSYEDRKNKHF